MADSVEPFSRPLGTTEQTWVRSVAGGTGITVLVILLSQPPDTSLLQTSLHRLQKLHPVLTASLSHSTLSSSSSLLSLQALSLSSTSHLLLSLSSPEENHLPPLHLLLEHELNRNPWTDPESASGGIFFATLYELPTGGKWVLALRLHTAVCDRTSGVAIMRELLELMTNGGAESEAEEENGFSPAVEGLIPKGKGDKPFWTRGIDLVGYSLNSVRLSNLEFGDVESTRSTAMVRLELNKEETHRITQGCNARGIKLCGALTAAGLVAAHLLKSLPDNQSEYFSIATLVDCRKILDPPLHEHNLGFYHSAIINTHSISNGEGLWDVARRCYDAFSNSMKWEKHFKDMGDLNFLMCKSIENPALTPSSSLRTSFMAVFEDPVFEGDLLGSLGVEDYMGCASVHGAGPSIAVFDTIRDGQLDCTCVFPFPLHSRKQMQELVDEMKNILVSGGE